MSPAVLLSDKEYKEPDVGYMTDASALPLFDPSGQGASGPSPGPGVIKQAPGAAVCILAPAQLSSHSLEGLQGQEGAEGCLSTHSSESCPFSSCCFSP